MPQASYDWQVFDFDAVEFALVAILRSGGIANAYGKRSTEVRATPCVELDLQTQAAQGHRYLRWPQINSDLVQPYNTFNFQLGCKITTERSENGTSHREIVGRTRFNLQYYRLTQTFTSTLCPFHSITDIRESVMSADIENELNLDLTLLTFTGMLNIRDNAWPSDIL